MSERRYLHLNLVAKDKRVLLSDVVDRYSAIPYGSSWYAEMAETRMPAA